tara:strand:+ start:746 stop:1150 length:405 start_codon:yes stop_codon:yes gene_type:complete
MSYAIKGVSSVEAWDILSQDPNAVLVDVRTEDETDYLGFPDLRDISRDVILIPLIKNLKTREENESFIQELEEKVKNKESKVMFICKSGGRSEQAAKAALFSGYKSCFNVIDGFGDGYGRGWKYMNLACRYKND